MQVYPRYCLKSYVGIEVATVQILPRDREIFTGLRDTAIAFSLNSHEIKWLIILKYYQ